MSEVRFRQLEERIKAIEKTRNAAVALEQYKILFAVIINLGDNVVKSVLSMLVVYFAVVAFVVQGISHNPNVKDILLVNYGLVFVFTYYLGYLRFRIVTMFKIVNEIEEKEKFTYRGIQNYEKITNYKFYSTKGLFVVLALSLIIINTIIYYFVL